MTKLDGYEVKASKADLGPTFNEGKWRRYLNTLHHLSFAFPSGLVATEEIPQVCGIIVYLSAKGTWRWVRRPPALDGFKCTQIATADGRRFDRCADVPSGDAHPAVWDGFACRSAALWGAQEVPYPCDLRPTGSGHRSATGAPPWLAA